MLCVIGMHVYVVCGQGCTWQDAAASSLLPALKCRQTVKHLTAPASCAICSFVSLMRAATSRRQRSLSARCCRSSAATRASHSLDCLRVQIRKGVCSMRLDEIWGKAGGGAKAGAAAPAPRRARRTPWTACSGLYRVMAELAEPLLHAHKGGCQLACCTSPPQKPSPAQLVL